MITVRVGHCKYTYFGDLESYFQHFREGIIGTNQSFHSPYGELPIVYADWFASGRLYKPIEKKLSDEFGPFMANTHTESNITSSVMTQAYSYARKLIKHHVNADEYDVILLDGAGMTSVVNKLQRILGFKAPEKLMKHVIISEDERPIIFITHLEHHSNHTSWLETVGDVVIIESNQSGTPNLSHLKELLSKYNHRKIKIGSFSACSNVTGVIPPYHQMARIMHEHNGICFVDFSASAPYVDIDMHPVNPLDKLDGIFFSPHKFLGGPGGSGVAVFDSRLYHNCIPDQPGGGTVTWTNPWGLHQYILDIEDRETGGTPAILQGIKAALAIKLKELMGVKNILDREKEMINIILPQLKEIPRLHILEEQAEHRLGVVSFYIEGIHYNLIVRLLNDRFGYQLRGGCSCAGTYGHYLYDIDQNQSEKLAKQVADGDMSNKPGWVRVSIHPTLSNSEVYHFIHAMRLISSNIKEWMKDYTYDPEANNYTHLSECNPDIDEMFDFNFKWS